jgi:hypothetical protein
LKVVNNEFVTEKDADANQLAALMDAVSTTAERQSAVVDEIAKMTTSGRLRYG